MFLILILVIMVLAFIMVSVSGWQTVQTGGADSIVDKYRAHVTSVSKSLAKISSHLDKYGAVRDQDHTKLHEIELDLQEVERPDQALSRAKTAVKDGTKDGTKDAQKPSPVAPSVATDSDINKRLENLENIFNQLKAEDERNRVVFEDIKTKIQSLAPAPASASASQPVAGKSWESTVTSTSSACPVCPVYAGSTIPALEISGLF